MLHDLYLINHWPSSIQGWDDAIDMGEECLDQVFKANPLRGRLFEILDNFHDVKHQRQDSVYNLQHAIAIGEECVKLQSGNPIALTHKTFTAAT